MTTVSTQAQTNPTPMLPLTTPLSSLIQSKLNPRKRFDETAVIELANSIAEHGLLQPLVVRPHPKQQDNYEIVAGERRFRALSWLLEQERIQSDYPVATIIRDVTDFELVLLATVENMQRSDMTPLEEADAFAQLVELGENEEGIALRTGVAASTVKLRLKLATGLSSKVRSALEKETINLSQAQALLLIGKGLQNELLPKVIDYNYSPKDIKRLVTQDKIPVGRNLFSLDKYSKAKGTIITDIFQPEHLGWFDSVELFIKLQNEAIENKLEDLKQSFSIVETTESFYAYQYVEGDGAVLELNPYSYEVDIHERVVRRPDLKEEPSQKQAKPRVNRRRDEWEATTLTRAVHEEASKDFRLCLVLNIMMLLGVEGFDVDVKPDKTTKQTPANQIFSETLQTAFTEITTKLMDNKVIEDLPWEVEPEDKYYPKVEKYSHDPIHIFHILKNMEEDELHTLFSQLTATFISHGYTDTPWNTDVKQMVANETQLEPQNYFDASNKDYLSLHTKNELAELAIDVEIPIDVTAMKKSDAVSYLSEHESIKNYLPERLLLDSEEELLEAA